MLDACFGYGVTLGARHDHHVARFESFDVTDCLEAHEFARAAFGCDVSRERVDVGE